MALSPTPGRRLSLLGCVLAGAAVLLLPGCGEEGSATADKATTTRTKAKSSAKAGAVAAGCPRQVEAFARALDSLRRQLAIGLSYEQYATRVRAARKSYDRLPISHLALDCLASTGTPAEAAFNEYVDAANAWGECLADASCTTATIEPVLQRKWRIASHFLSEAE